MNKNLPLLKNAIITPFAEMSDDFKVSIAGISQQLNKSDIRAVVVCGAVKGVGATTVAACLAEQEALYKRVLLIDCNIHSPRINARYSIKSEGITDYLSLSTVDKPLGDNYIKSISNKVGENLTVISAGNSIANASVFMFSGVFQQKYDTIIKGYDMVIIDCADLELCSDAVRLAGATGKILLVVGNYTRRKQITNAFNQCDVAGVEVVGMVLNTI